MKRGWKGRGFFERRGDAVGFMDDLHRRSAIGE
jgi:hypothetical protein